MWYIYKDASKVDSHERNEYAKQVKSKIDSGEPYYFISTGDMLIVGFIEQETGEIEIYDCIVNRVGHYANKKRNHVKVK